MIEGKMLAVTALLAIALCSCSEDPTEANALVAGLPLGDVIVRDSTVLATGSSTYKQFIPLDGRLNLVGHTGGYDAKSLLAFYSSYFPLRDTALVYSARLKLRFVTWFGGTSGQLAFNVYRITRSWDGTLITWDSVQAGLYDASVVRGDTSLFAGPDTISSLTVQLDTAMVHQWLLSTAAEDAKFGIALVPAAGCNIIGGFTAFDSDSTQFQPQLEIIAGSATGPERDTATYFQGIDTFVGNIDNLNANPQLVYVQSGVDYRARMSFDVSFIPRGAVINSALLLLQRDPATTRLTKFTTDTAFSIQTSLSPTDSTSLDAGVSTGGRVPGTANTFSVDARRPVQIWLRGPNYGITLRPNGLFEYSTLDLITFYSEQATLPANRPRLKIIYSIPR